MEATISSVQDLTESWTDPASQPDAIGPEDLPPDQNQHFSKVGFWRNNCTRKKVLKKGLLPRQTFANSFVTGSLWESGESGARGHFRDMEPCFLSWIWGLHHLWVRIWFSIWSIFETMRNWYTTYVPTCIAGRCIDSFSSWAAEGNAKRGSSKNCLLPAPRHHWDHGFTV